MVSNPYVNISVSDWIQIGICAVAVAGIFVNLYSIRKQTRYQLFDDRMKLLTDINEYIKRYEESILKLDLDHYEAEFVSGFLDNSAKLLFENIFGYSAESLSNNIYIAENNYDKLIIDKLGDVRMNALKCELLFKNNYANKTKDFIICYYDFLTTLYKYKLRTEHDTIIKGNGEHLSLTSKARELRKRYSIIIDGNYIHKMAIKTRLFLSKGANHEF